MLGFCIAMLGLYAAMLGFCIAMSGLYAAMLGFCIAMLGLYTASESDLYPDNDGTVSQASTQTTMGQ